MNDAPRTVTQVLIGTAQVGMIGLREAFEVAEGQGAGDETVIVERALERLRVWNYVPESQLAELHRTLRREWRRQRGEDFSEFFTEIETVVRARPGGDRDRFVERTREILAEFELMPALSLELPSAGEKEPELLLRGESIVAGPCETTELRRAVRRWISHW